MRDVSLKNLEAESRAAVEFRDKHTQELRERIEGYHGPYYNGKTQEYNPENHAFEHLSLYVPRTVYDNPRVKVGTRRPGSQQDTAEAIGHGLNRWVKSVGLRHTLDAVAYDYFMLWGAVITSQEPIPGMSPMETVEIFSWENEEAGKKKVLPHWPKVYRLSPRHFFVDPRALHESQASFKGHDSIRAKTDLISQAKANPKEGWNVEVIEGLSDDAGVDDYYDVKDSGRDVPARHEIVLREIWVPDHELDDSPGSEKGYHGTVFTLGVGQTAEGEERTDMIREPRPYYGPRWGPYTMFGTYTVPDHPYPLSGLTAVQGQVEDLNNHVAAMNRNADKYARLVLVDASKPDEAQKIADGTDSFVIPVTNLDSTKVVPIEKGGITTQHLAMVGDKRDRLDRNSGMHEAQRGVVTGKGTATEVQEASETSDTRAGYIQRRYEDAVTSCLKTVAWYLYYDDRVIFPMGSDAQKKLGFPEDQEPWYFGGLHDPRSGATFEDLELEIEAHSMERANEGSILKRTLEGLGFLVQAAPQMAQIPYVDWPGVMNDLGNALNMPNLGERIRLDVLEEMTGIQMEAQERENEARLTKDAGAAGQILPYQKPAVARELMGGVAGSMTSGNMRSA